MVMLHNYSLHNIRTCFPVSFHLRLTQCLLSLIPPSRRPSLLCLQELNGVNWAAS